MWLIESHLMRDMATPLFWHMQRLLMYMRPSLIRNTSAYCIAFNSENDKSLI